MKRRSMPALSDCRLNSNAAQASAKRVGGRGAAKSGWREIGGRRLYMRSRWEANYALYLQFLKDRFEIADWEYEPKTFWFEGIRRGTVSYKPDFRVVANDGTHAWHEVKGWMDDRSRVALARMSRYFPDERVIVIDKSWFRDAVRIGFDRILAGWDRGEKVTSP